MRRKEIFTYLMISQKGKPITMENYNHFNNNPQCYVISNIIRSGWNLYKYKRIHPHTKKLNSFITYNWKNQLKWKNPPQAEFKIKP